MSVYVTNSGQLSTESVRLSGTSATTIVDPGNTGCFVEHIRVVNTGSNTPNITIDRYDGTTAFILLQEHSLPAKSAESTELNEPKSIYRDDIRVQLERGDLLRVTSSVGSNEVHVHAMVVRPAVNRT